MMEAGLTFHLLGGAEIHKGGKPLALTAVKTRALLFYLAVTNRLHSRDTLATLLWPEMPDATAKTNLRQALTALRKLLPDQMKITRHDVVLNLEGVVVDVHDFETAVRHGGSQNIAQLQEAAALYGGDLLKGFLVENAAPFNDWVVPLREHLRSLALQTLHTLADYFTRRRNVALGLQYTGQLLLLEPWREASHQQMMRLLAWNGQFAAALAQYKTCEQLLDEALGVEPLPETVQLYDRILDAREATRGSIPLSPDPFIDRDELGAVTSWLHDPDCRLLTVVGVGGAGKTRLVMQTAVQQIPLYLDGVYFVELAGLEGGGQLTAAIAHTVGLTFSGSKSNDAQLQDFLRYKETLLVLDNFEHLLREGYTDVAIDLLLDLLETATDLKLLLSSRERLNLDEEWVFELQGLPYPETINDPGLANYASVQLFQQTAVRARRSFDLATESAAVAKICRLMQGLPLGIKLAASLIKGQTAVQIAEALRNNLDVLSTRLRNVPGRHRSLRATFDYSWQLLAAKERSLLASLSLFRGGFDLQAAQSVAEATLAGLTTLVDKSLLNFGENGRYELHVLLREFAAEQFAAADLDEVRRRYSDYFLRWLGNLAEAIQGSGSKTAVSQIRETLDNIRQAWHWSVAQKQFTHFAAALPSLTQYYALSGSSQEGLQLVQEAITALDALPTQQPRKLLLSLLTAQAHFLRQSGLATEAKQALERAMTLVRTEEAQEKAAVFLQWGRTFNHEKNYDAARTRLEKALTLAQQSNWRFGERSAHLALAHIFRYLGQFESAEHHARRGLALARLAGNQHHEGEGLYLLAMITDDRGEFDVAAAYGDEALALIEALGNQRLQAAILSTMSLNYNSLGQFERAKVAAQQALHLNRTLGDEIQTARQLNNLGLMAMNLGNLVEAKSFYEQSLAIDRRLGSYLTEGVVLGNLGDVAMSMGDFFQAEAYYEAGIAIRRELNDLRGVSWMLCSLSLLAGKRGKYADGLRFGKEALDVLAITKERAKIGYAWTHLGHAHLGLAELEAAKEAYETALAIRRELGQGHLTVINVAGLAEVALQQNDLELARKHAETLLRHIADDELGGTRESGRVAWSCYQVLDRLEDERGVEVLETAVSQIETIAQRIRNKNQRRDYRSNVFTHRNLLAAAAASHSI